MIYFAIRMESRFIHYHYYLPEFYNKILKDNRISTKYSTYVWKLSEKIEFFNYLKCGFPCSPILLSPSAAAAKEYTCIDGVNRIYLIIDFMLGGLRSYFSEDDRERIEKMSIDIYISASPLQDDICTLIRRSFHVDMPVVLPPSAPAPPAPPPAPPAAPSAPPAPPAPPAPESNNVIVVSQVKKVTANIKTKIPKKQIHESLKTSVWNKYIGQDKGTAPCWVCQFTPITQREFDTGHVIAEINGGATHIDNLRPICRKCNLSMGAQNMETFKERFYGERL